MIYDYIHNATLGSSYFDTSLKDHQSLTFNFDHLKFQVDFYPAMLECPVPPGRPFPDIVTLASAPCSRVTNALMLKQPRMFKAKDLGLCMN